MKKILKTFRKKIIFIKLCIFRCSGWLALINTGMILILFLSKLKETGWIGWEIDKYVLSIFIIGLVCLAVLGWLEIKLGGQSEESALQFRLSPPMSEMKQKIDKIYEKLNETRK